jgi:prepilin-type N-terminal cleavage/methylation domain-containing protein
LRALSLIEAPVLINTPLTKKIGYDYDGLNMKLFSAQKKSRFSFFNPHLAKGFTLIELLVVIGILGILAAALIATIDPFEQLNKATDANSKNTAVEFLNANLRYYTTHSAMPWYATGGANGGGADCFGGTNTLSGINLNDPAFLPCLTTLVGEGELKQAFTTATGILGSLYATDNGSGNIIMCYDPKSKSQERDVNTKYDQYGVTSALTTCSGGPNNAIGSTTCFWCTQ